MSYLIYVVIGVIGVLACLYRYGWIVTSDGQAYIEIANGKPGLAPFRWRLVARLLGRSPRLWVGISWTALVASTALVGVYADQHGLPGWAAAALFVSLPYFRGLVRIPIVTDHLGMFFALAAGVAPWWAAIPLGVLAGCCNEKAPIFAAIFAWSPLPLVGLVVPATMVLLTRGGPKSLHNSWKLMRELHNKAQPHIYILPWGVCLLGVLTPTYQLLLAIVFGYAQMLVATDRSRLYQMGAPVVILATLAVLPAWALLPAILTMIALPSTDFVAPWK